MPTKMLTNKALLKSVVLLGSAICLLIWYELMNLPDATVVSPAYTLFTQNDTKLFDAIFQLPKGDYNQLIDLNFNFSMINLICIEKSVLLLVLVHSAARNFARRKTIRETWGRKEDNIKVVFMIGSVISLDWQKKLETENLLYNDIVQGSFADTYRNLTYKHVMALKYFIYHCPQAKYILKADDDVFVNMPTMKNFLTYDLSPFGASKGLFCTPKFKKVVKRSSEKKWSVSFSEYRNRIYPTFCPGWTLLYTPDVAFGLYKEAQKSKYFWIDDIHITGTLAQKLYITHTNIEFLVLSYKNLNKIIKRSYNASRPFLYGGFDLADRTIRMLWKFVTTHKAPKFIFRHICV